MSLSNFRVQRLLVILVIFFVAALLLLFGLQKTDRVKLLYAAGGTTYDASAFGNFEQTLNANAEVEVGDLRQLSARALKRYDAIYLDPGLPEDRERWPAEAEKLMQYVNGGGRLLLENSFAQSFPADFLGVREVVDLPPAEGKPAFGYPQVGTNLQSLQQIFRLFTDAYFQRETMDSLPGFHWGNGLIPDTAQPIVTLNGYTLCAVNQVGAGSVVISSAFLPNRYFPTGYDLQSGMDPASGFPQLAEKYKQANPPVQGAAYFNRKALPLEPYFDFAFASANMQYRSELLAYVSKEKLGYSVKKVLGPYGRPAMAFQNHFEAMPAIRQKDGIAWAELLKSYKEIPSFTLVRSAFYWGQWRESLTVQLNTGTNAQPQFAGELPGSGYASGMHLMSGGQPLRLALFPQYRDLSSAIELPYRAYPAAADLNGDGRTDLLVGSADGFVYIYTNQGQNAAAYASETPPPGLALPDTFGAPQKLELEAGIPLQLQPYSSVHAADVNADGKPDLIVSDESGAVLVLPQQDGGSFGAPAALSAGGQPLQLPAGPGAAATVVADVNGDGKLDLVVGMADGRVLLYAGSEAAALALDAGAELFRLPAGARYAAPAVRDMNGDGRPDLVVGSNEGDLQVFLQTADGGWTNSGPLEGDTRNQVGSRALVAGHHSVPLWLDVNGDGRDDLIVGGVEFGSPVPIDDPQFPYRQELDEFITYAKEHHLELDPHVFVHNFKSAEQERQELDLQKQAFERLGIPWNTPGTNQHTWRVNAPDGQQTLRSEQQQAIWFNFGFFPAHSPAIARPEAVWTLPFLLQSPDNSLMLLHNPTPVLRLGEPSNTDIFESMAALDMPIDYFEHIEYHFPESGKVAGLTQFAAYFDQMRTAQDYNFMTETQMARSFLTAMKGKARISRPWAVYLWDKLKDRLAPGNPHWHGRLTPDVSDVPAQAGEYADALGVVIEKGEKLMLYSLTSDSDIYHSKGARYYIGTSRPVSLSIRPSEERLHLIRSNVPFTMRHSGSFYEIELKEPGLQQLKLYSPEELQFAGDGLDVEYDALTRTYTITRYGDRASFTFSQANSEKQEAFSHATR